MAKFTKIVSIILLIGLATSAIGYGGYKAYIYIMEDISLRIQKSVSEGVTEGITEGVGRTINPFKWFRKKKPAQ